MTRGWQIKLKMLWLYLPNVRDWYLEVWQQDAYARMCCNGYECGCGGSCYEEMWEYHWRTRRAKR